MSLKDSFKKNTYGDEYFNSRLSNDFKRIKSFKQEIKFLNKYISSEGNVCDVGCSTGEFLKAYSWQGSTHGMEVNEMAISKAEDLGIDFQFNILNKKNYFDLVIFRGTIQHIPDPFTYIAYAYKSLKPGGHLVFLATPNINSIVYKLFNDLPALDPPRNFYIPSDKTLINVCKNAGFDLVDIEYPYIHSPYASLISDHFKFISSIMFNGNIDYPFWKSMMNVIFVK